MRGPDHPRSRGVYSGLRTRRRRPAGSSPLARGLPVCRMVVTVRVRIIPARAGFTVAPRQGVPASPDHPRSRGVYHARCRQRQHTPGSSPLARGLLVVTATAVCGRGIIPARAGFTGCAAGRARGRRDHPRSRGVYASHRRAVAGAGGSSPLARGLRMALYPMGREERIIPARAGFTRREPTCRAAPRDHPRSRGVYASQARRRASWAGSSPLARGLHAIVTLTGPDGGIIPARAGFTVFATHACT